MEGTPTLPPAGHDGDGRLVTNIMYFARTLRAAGLPIGPGKVLAAVEAVRAVGLESRRDFYWTLFSVFVNRRDQRELFDQAFHIFWRNPKILERMLGAFVLLTELGQRLPANDRPTVSLPTAKTETNKRPSHLQSAW